VTLCEALMSCGVESISGHILEEAYLGREREREQEGKSGNNLGGMASLPEREGKDRLARQP
jgi:hypothetical protein